MKMPSSRKETLRYIEESLNEQINTISCYWFGRAATALYFAYKAIRAKHPHISTPEIILPAMSCATPVNVAILAGLKVRFVDIDVDTGLMSVESIQQRYSLNTVAVVFIHLYGNTANLQALKHWCLDRGIALIEDLAQALGGCQPDGRYVGSYGDFSVFSFNKTKIIEVGGGLLTLHNHEYVDFLERAVRDGKFEDIDASKKEALAVSYRNLHHALVGLFRLKVGDYRKIHELFWHVRDAYDSLYVQKYRYNSDLLSVWQSLSDILERRREKAAIYEQNLGIEDDYWELLNGWHLSRVCWRFSLLVKNPDKLTLFSELVRKDGFHVSNLYWPMDQFFYPKDTCPNADYFARRIINLWVDESVSENYVRACAESLSKHKSILKEHS